MTEDLIHKGAEIMEWKCVPTGNTSHLEDSEKWVNEKGEDIIEGRSMLDQVWNPLESWDDCMQLVDKLREKGYTFNMHIDEEGIGFVVFANADEGIEVVFSRETEIKDVREAILTAATKI